MAKYKITKPVDFGPWTIGDKNYGPACPSCKVLLNNYAPRVGDIVEGEIQMGNYYVYFNNQKHLRTGRGIFFPINTNGPASTQAQSTIQFITEDHLALEIEPVEPEPNNPGSPNNPASPTNPETPSNTGQTICWLCENRMAVIWGILIIVVLAVLIGKD